MKTTIIPVPLKTMTKAIELNPSIELPPNAADAYNNRGQAYYAKNGDYNRAIADYTKAIELKPVIMPMLPIPIAGRLTVKRRLPPCYRRLYQSHRTEPI